MEDALMQEAGPAKAGNAITRLFFQVSEGCGYDECQNRLCASNKDVAPKVGNEAAILITNLIKANLNDDLSDYQCPATLQLHKVKRGLLNPTHVIASDTSITHTPNSSVYKSIVDIVREVFSSSESLNRSFLHTHYKDDVTPILPPGFTLLREVQQVSCSNTKNVACTNDTFPSNSNSLNMSKQNVRSDGMSEEGVSNGLQRLRDGTARAYSNRYNTSFSSTSRTAGCSGVSDSSNPRAWDHNKFLITDTHSHQEAIAMENLHSEDEKLSAVGEGVSKSIPQDLSHLRAHGIRVSMSDVLEVYDTVFAIEDLRKEMLSALNTWATKLKTERKARDDEKSSTIPPNSQPSQTHTSDDIMSSREGVSQIGTSSPNVSVSCNNVPSTYSVGEGDLNECAYRSASEGSGLGQYVIVFENPALMEHEYLELVMPQLLCAIANLSDSAQDRLSLYWSRNGQSRMLARVQKTQQYITMRILTKSGGCESYSPNKDKYIAWAVKALAVLFRANMLTTLIQSDTSQPIVPLTEFYNDAINDHINLRTDFPIWKASDGGFSFCHYPFVLTPGTKSEILKVECIVQMRHEMQDAYFRSIFHGPNDPYLFLTIRRTHLIRDALLQLQSKNPKDLKKQLRVTFVGEEGVDEGGVQKEFFQLVIRDIFDPKYGMFTYNEDAHHYWINPTSAYLGCEGEFFLVGLVLGLAIYNSIILDVRFPNVVYKKLTIPAGSNTDVYVDVSLDDLKDADPELARGLSHLLTFEGDVASTYNRTFQVEYDLFGKVQTVDLKPQGGNIPLNNENRREYVDLYVQWVLNRSIETQFRELKRGFDAIAAGGALQLFRHEELELLVCGCRDVDFEALEASTEYDGGFTESSPVIVNFWSIVHAFTDEQKKRLLFFATGSDRVPIGGLANLHFVIAKNGGDSERLPTAHTCFNVLLLCDYATKESLQSKILTAIENAEGFGML
eukprot:CFRG0658T1